MKQQLRTFLIGVVGGAVIVAGAAGWWMYYRKENPPTPPSTVQASAPKEQEHEKSWHVVQTFTGPGTLKANYSDEELKNMDTHYKPAETQIFELSGERVRITFENQFNDLVPNKCLFMGPTVMLFPAGESVKYTKEIEDKDCNGIVSEEFDGTFDIPKGRYYFKVFSIYDWKITVEEYK